MPNWITVLEASKLPLNTQQVVLVFGKSLLLINHENQLYAVKNQCTHEDKPLAGADIEDGVLTCPFHHAQFCIKTGEVKAPPAFEDLETFEIRLSEGMLQVLL